MEILIVVRARVERDEGKFASREEIEEEFTSAIESADPSSIYTSDGATYSVTEYEVEALDPAEFARIEKAGRQVLAERKAKRDARKAAAQ